MASKSFIVSALKRFSDACCKNHILSPSSERATYATMNRADTPEVEHMKKLLWNKFPLAKNIEINDISGGCGSMYEVMVESVEFQGLTTVKQHRLVNEALKKEIEGMHGIRIQTLIPHPGQK